MTLEEQAKRAVARGWSHPKNAQKEMDADLAEAITEEIVRSFSPAPPPRHEFKAHQKHQMFCDECGYVESEGLKHLPNPTT